MAICNSAVLACLLAKPLASLTLLSNSSLPFTASLSFAFMRAVFLPLSHHLSQNICLSQRYRLLPLCQLSLLEADRSAKDAAGFSFPQLAHCAERGPTGSALCLDV